MRTTTLDFSILGLLLSGRKTAYAIRMIFKSTAMGNYSSSPGSIYPATAKLRTLELIDKEENGLLRITKAGKIEMKSWLTQPITEQMVAKESHILILKFAFMDYLVSFEEKISFLESFWQQTKLYLESLETYAESSEGLQLPVHSRLSFEYGLASLKTQLSCIKSTLVTLEKEQLSS